MTPPNRPLELFQKFIRFGSRTLPLRYFSISGWLWKMPLLGHTETQWLGSSHWFLTLFKYLLFFSHTSQKYEWTVVILDNSLDCCLWCKNLVLLRLLTEWSRYVENQEEIIRALAQISETKKERAAIIAQPRVSIYKCVGCWCSMEEN